MNENECNICFSNEYPLYNFPRCSHSICYHCLVQLALHHIREEKNAQEFRCPMCRTAILEPRVHVEPFQIQIGSYVRIRSIDLKLIVEEHGFDPERVYIKEELLQVMMRYVNTNNLSSWLYIQPDVRLQQLFQIGPRPFLRSLLHRMLDNHIQQEE
jgi:hypothetical protein